MKDTVSLTFTREEFDLLSDAMMDYFVDTQLSIDEFEKMSDIDYKSMFKRSKFTREETLSLLKDKLSCIVLFVRRFGIEG